ncbi:MAG: hypothetical protein RL226_411 [Bacteroidota bacterium]
MERKVVLTADGSSTIQWPDGETYHSKHGALQESLHVFIDAGLRFLSDRRELKVFELGFGTGLNALLAAEYASQTHIHVAYTSIEAFPLTNEWEALNYRVSHPALFSALHKASWGLQQEISPDFTLEKHHTTLVDFSFPENHFDVVFWDAFSPRSQPDLWTESAFERVFASMKSGGLLTTYCAQGQVRRNMKAAGLVVEKIPGPPGKREMMRAFKP